jgi:hypothetical protein
MVWSIQDIKSEIESTSDLLKIRWQAIAGSMAGDAIALSYTKLEDSMIKSICSKLNTLSCLDACGNMCLFNTLNKSSLGESVKATIQTAIDDKMASIAESAVHEPVDTTKTQKLVTPWNYLTQTDWDAIYDARTPYFKKSWYSLLGSESWESATYTSRRLSGRWLLLSRSCPNKLVPCLSTKYCTL